MLATIAPATGGQALLPNELCGPALDAAQCAQFAPEITAEGRGSTVYHALANVGTVPARDFAAWLCLEKKCSRVSDMHVHAHASARVSTCACTVAQQCFSSTGRLEQLNKLPMALNCFTPLHKRWTKLIVVLTYRIGVYASIPGDP